MVLSAGTRNKVLFAVVAHRVTMVTEGFVNNEETCVMINLATMDSNAFQPMNRHITHADHARLVTLAMMASTALTLMSVILCDHAISKFNARICHRVSVVNRVHQDIKECIHKVFSWLPSSIKHSNVSDVKTSTNAKKEPCNAVPTRSAETLTDLMSANVTLVSPAQTLQLVAFKFLECALTV